LHSEQATVENRKSKERQCPNDDEVADRANFCLAQTSRLSDDIFEVLI
jgi:hypothetical protein